MPSVPPALSNPMAVLRVPGCAWLAPSCNAPAYNTALETPANSNTTGTRSAGANPSTTNTSPYTTALPTMGRPGPNRAVSLLPGHTSAANGMRKKL